MLRWIHCALILTLMIPAWADGPLVPDGNRLYGITKVLGGPEGDDQGPDWDILFDLYEKSGATVIYVSLDWGICEKTDPGSGESKYDFSQLDRDLHMKSSKTKVCWISLYNGWADKVKEEDPARYEMLAERFVTAATRHANKKGIKYFQVPGNEFDLLGRGDWAILYVEPMKLIYKGVKAAGKDNIVIAGNLSNGLDNTVQAFYDAGAKDYFDILDLHTYSNDSRSGVDIFQVVAAHRAMERNGDGHKKILLGEGWGPMRELPTIRRHSDEIPASQQEIEEMRGFLLNGYRNMLTKRDIYDPDWLIGARFFTMNDNYGQKFWKPRAKYVDEDGDGTIDAIILDGYRFDPDMDMEPRFFNGGLVNYDGTPKADLLDLYPGKFPRHKFEGRLALDGRTSGPVTGQPHRLIMTVTNLSDDEMKLDKFGVNWKCLTSKTVTVDARPVGQMPGSLAPGGRATVQFDVTFPQDTAGKEIILIGELDYSARGTKYLTDCWVTVNVISPIGMTLSPGRLVLDERGRLNRLRMRLENNTASQYDKRIILSTKPGIRVRPSEIDVSIPPGSTRTLTLSINAVPGTSPGHHPLVVDLGNGDVRYLSIQVPLVALRAQGEITVDGRLDDWIEAAQTTLIDPPGSPTEGAVAGRVWFCYDDAGFHAAFAIDDPDHIQNWPATELFSQDSIQIAFDPLMDGPRTPTGGYRVDDYEYGFAGTSTGPIVYSSKTAGDKPVGVLRSIPFAFRHVHAERCKSYYEITFPWSELEPFAYGKSRSFAMSILLNRTDGAGRIRSAWGEGIRGPKDPTYFIPIILAR